MINDHRDIATSQADGHISHELVDLAASATTELGTILSNNDGTWTPYDGTRPAAGVLREIGVWATKAWPAPFAPAADGTCKALVLVRHAELNRARLIGLDADAETALAAHALIVRTY